MKALRSVFAVFAAALLAGAPAHAAPQTSAKPEATVEIRPAESSDFAVAAPKDWDSPVAFDTPATWLETMRVDDRRKIDGVPIFRCDGVRFSKLDMHRYSQARFHAWVHLEPPERQNKILNLEFTLVSGTRKLTLCSLENEFVEEGGMSSHGCGFTISKEDFAAFTADGADPQLRVAMAIRD